MPSKKAPSRAAKKAPPPAAKKAPPRAAKKAPSRVANKVSPLRGMSIDDWIAHKTSDWQTDVVKRMVAVVKAAAPTATASIKWSQPIFEENGPFAFIMKAKAHVSFGFWRGAEVIDPAGILERGPRMGHFKVKKAADLDEKALAKMVKDAVRLNREKGSPTKRG